MSRTELSPAATTRPLETLATWLLADGKPGHEAQLRGLAQALARRQPVDLTWVDVRRTRVTWTDLLRGRYPGLPRTGGPHLAVAAGHASHRPLLALGRATGCMTCVLMQPSLPAWCFDAAIVPRHDRPRRGENVLVTEGVLNPIAPASNPDASRGLILLGGPSPHFRFPVQDVCRQVAALCTRFPTIEWSAGTSRRTPVGTAESLRAMALANLQVVACTDTPTGWVADSLSRCGQAWITGDSVSMVYEALSAGIATGLLELPTKRRGRLQRGIAELQSRAMLNRLDAVLAGRDPAPPPRALQEADRAADWLLQRLPQADSA
ncbi:MAG: ELM1/GtrOC1 family putative glycosyltransferase [Chromatocurvus sp.]